MKIGFTIEREPGYLTPTCGWTNGAWALTLIWPTRKGWASRTWRWYR